MKSKIPEHNSIYRGSLMTFQHYLNCYYFLLPLEERFANTKEYLFEIKEEYENAILRKIVIKRKELKQSGN